MERKEASAITTYKAVLRRRQRLMSFVGVPVLLGFLVLACALPDIYESSGLVNIEQERVEGVKSSSRSASDEYIQEYVRSIAATLLTPKGLQDAVRTIPLYPDLRDDAKAAATRMAADTRIDVVRSTILDQTSGREREIISAFRITYGNRDPELAYRGANWLTNAFLQADRSRRAGREGETAAFFAKEAERVSVDVMKLEQKLSDLRRRNYGQLPELSAFNLTAMDRMERDLENAQAQITALRRDRIFIAQRLAEANSTYGNADQLARAEEELRKKVAIYDPSHPDVVSLRRQIETLRLSGTTDSQGGGGATLQDQLAAQRATLVQARQRYSADHPDIRRIQRQIQELENRIASGEKNSPAAGIRTAASEQLEVQLRSTDSQIASLEGRAAGLRGKMGEVERRMAATPDVERESLILNRDITQARAKYEQLLNSRMDAEVTKAAIEQGKADEFRILQQPFQSVAPAKPKRVAIAAVGVFLAFFLSVVVGFIAEFVDPAVRNVRDLESILSILPLAVIPTIQVTQRGR